MKKTISLNFLSSYGLSKTLSVLISAFCGGKKETERFRISLRRTAVGHNYIRLVHTTLPWFSTQVPGLNPWVGRSGECFASFDLFCCRCCDSVETCALQAFIKQRKNSAGVSFCEDSFFKKFLSFQLLELLLCPNTPTSKDVGAARMCASRPPNSCSRGRIRTCVANCVVVWLAYFLLCVSSFWFAWF